MAAALLVGTQWARHGASPVGAGASATASPSRSTALTTSSPTAVHSSASAPGTPSQVLRAARQAAAGADIKRRIASAPIGAISVAAYDTVTRHSYSAGAESGMTTASTYKLFVLETLLLQRQDAGGRLSDAEVAQATPMIENSDNPAGYRLFLDAGGAPALASAAQRFDMTHTVPAGDDPTFTTTSARDLLVLVNNLVSDGPLDAVSREFALGLMRQVAPDQRWGVGVTADPGTAFANKNGWLDSDHDGGLWTVNSLGVVTVHKHPVLMAIMTQHGPDFQSGIDLVETLAKATATALTG